MKRNTNPGISTPFIPVIIPSTEKWDVYLIADKPGNPSYTVNGPRKVAESFAKPYKNSKIVSANTAPK
jgi:hypothetical protein